MKKLISTFLLISMLFSLLVSCGKTINEEGLTSETNTTDHTVASVDGGAATESATEAPEYVKPDADYTGKTFTFSSVMYKNPNWIATSYVEAAKPEINGDIINDSIYERIVATEEMLGITVESNIYDSDNAIMNMVMAGDYIADCIILEGLEFASVLPQGLLIDLHEIDTLDLNASWWDSNATKSLSLGGKLYGAVGDISPMGLLAANCVYVNRALLTTAGLSDPAEYVKNGTWTYDKMEEMGRVVAHDVNGDGKMREEDIFGLDSEPIGYVAAGSCGVIYTAKDENDLPVLALDQERAIAAIEKLVPLFRNKDITLYSQDFTSSGFKNIFRDLIVQKFIEDEILFVNNWLCVALELRDMESDFGLLPPPKLDEQQESYMVYNSPSWTTYTGVPKTIKDENLNFIGDVMNALGYYGHEHIYTALIDTAITYKSLRDEGNREMMELIYANRIFDLADIYDFGGISSMMNSFISGNSTNFTSMYKSYSKIIEKQIRATANSVS